MLELAPVAFQSTPLLVLLLTLQGMAHTNGSSGSQTPKRPNKRPRRPDMWKKNVAKTKRAKGESCLALNGQNCTISLNR